MRLLQDNCVRIELKTSFCSGRHVRITDDMIVNILEVTAKLETPQVFTSLYLLAFFSFLRLSNMVPHSFKNFDVSRHLGV